MNKRLTFTAAAVALTLALLVTAPLALGGPASQADPTRQQQTIDALVNERFTQTAEVQQALDMTRTAEANTALGPTLTAQFEATVDAAFDRALTATALAELDAPALVAGAAERVATAESFRFTLAPPEPVKITLNTDLLPADGVRLVRASGEFEDSALTLDLALQVDDEPLTLAVVVTESGELLSGPPTEGAWVTTQLFPGLAPAGLRGTLAAALRDLSAGVSGSELVEPMQYRASAPLSPERAAALTLGLAYAGEAGVIASVLIDAGSGLPTAVLLERPQDGAPEAWTLAVSAFNQPLDVTARLPQPTETPAPGAPTPRPDIFPTDVVSTVQIVEQSYQGGRLFWIRHTRQIWVMLTDPDMPGRGEWLCYNDTFTEGEMETDPDLVPPDEDLIQPRRGFGKLWRNNDDLRDDLGWAITPELEVDSQYTYVAGGTVQNGQYVPGPGEHRLTTFNNESISFYEQDIRGDCMGGEWYLGGRP